MSEHRPRRDAVRRTAILVLGMHRSGTSALTRLVNLLGARLPEDLLPANPTNPAGHWESNRIVAIHDDLLCSIGSSWDDWRRVPRNWFTSAEARSFSQKLDTAITEEFGDSPLFVVKDPRMCRLLPLWTRTLKKLRIRPVAILITRNPLEVARSLQERDGFALDKSFRLWLRHVLESESESRPLPRCFITYEQLLTSWQPLMADAESRLGITWPRTLSDAATEVAQFISDGLHRSRATDHELRAAARTFPWLIDAYAVVERLARRAARKTEWQRLDDIKTRFDEAAAVFGSNELLIRPQSVPLLSDAIGALTREFEQHREEVRLALEEFRSSARREHDSEARRVEFVRLQQEPASQQDVQRLEDELRARRNEADQLNRDTAIFKRDAEALLNERTTHLGEIDALHNDLARRKTEIAALQREVAARQGENDQLRAELGTRGRDVDALRDDLTTRHEAVEVLDKALASERLDVQALQQEVHTHRRATDTLQRAVAVQSEIIAGLQKEVASRGAESERLKGELLRRREELETLHDELVARSRPVGAPPRETDQSLESREPAPPVPVSPLDAMRSPVRLHGPRFLVITDAIPTPDLDAGSFRLFEILKLLTDIGFRVTLASHSLEPRPNYAHQLHQLGILVMYGAGAALAHLEREGDQYAYVMLSRPDIAFAYLFPVRAHAIRAKVAFDTVDLHWVRMERAAALSGDRKMMENAQHYKRVELFSAAGSDLVLAVTMSEKEFLLNEDASLNVDILPTIHPSVNIGGPWRNRRDLMFIGGFWHHPNEDGVCHFVEQILPLVLIELPDVVFNIIGSHITDRVRNLASSSVRALGYVPDPTSYFTESRVFVSPLRFGAGMKGKIGQSMSYGLPVVTTSIGAEGMMLADGETALIADDPQSFAQAVVRLYTDEALWQGIAERSVSHIAQHFSDHAARRRLEAIFPVEAVAIGERHEYAS